MQLSVMIIPADASNYRDLAIMVGELLGEIMKKTNRNEFKYDLRKTELYIKRLITNNNYWVYIARDIITEQYIGFISMYESYALYTNGAFGTISELYVRPEWRTNNIGKDLIMLAKEFAQQNGWHRIEVTTPSLPEFDSTLRFYQSNGFSITGGKKLKFDIYSRNS